MGRPASPAHTQVHVAAMLSMAAGPLLALSPDLAGAGEISDGRVELHGFLLGSVCGRTTGEQPPGGEGGDFVLGEERLRFDLGAATESGDGLAAVKGDLSHDAVADQFDVDLREGYAGYSRGPWEARLGRQILTWGVGDLFFINDIFPKDWESFFSGRPMEYLKLGVDGARLQYSSEFVSADFLTIPFFTPDTLPSPRRFFVFDPAARVQNQRTVEPEPRYSTTEFALRIYRQVARFDLSAYFYRGFWRMPGLRLDNPIVPTTATRFFPKLSVYGASLQRNLLGGVLSLEGGYYDSREDRRGKDPGIPNPEWRALLGYQVQPWEDFTASLQAFSEVMTHYRNYRSSLPAGIPIQDELRWVASVRLTQFLDYQALKLSFFAAYSPSDLDYFLQPEASYKVTDSLSITLGANVFGGETSVTFFGQFDKDDNLFLIARFDF